METVAGLLTASRGGGSGAIVILLGAGPSVNTDKSDIKSMARAHLVTLRAEAKAAVASIPDEMSRYHLQDIIARIDKALDPSN